MEERFVTYNELVNYFEKEIVEDDIEDLSTFGVCSISDFLFLTEDGKKGKLNLCMSIDEIHDKFINGPVNNGQIFIAELSKEQLTKALFDEMKNELDFSLLASNSTIDPKNTISYLVIKNTEYTCWTEKVFIDMLENISM